MNVSEIAIRVKRQFGDEAGVQVTDADIMRWINDAMVDIAVNNDLFQVIASCDTEIGRPDYSVPSVLLAMRGVRYDNMKLQGVSPEEADQENLTLNTSTGTPVKFSQYADMITLYPAPDSVKKLQIYFTRNPKPVDDVNDVPEIATQYHNRIVEYCVAQAADSDDDLQRHQLKMGQFKDGIDALKDNATWMEQDFYPSITAGPNDTCLDYETTIF